MDMPQLVFFGIFAAIGGTFIFKRLKYGSWTGAFLSGKIQRTVGEVVLSQSALVSRRLRVDILDGAPSEESAVGLTITMKATLGASMMPFRLTRQQALELSGLLQQATK
jgi:hypothetical protein